MRFNWYNTEGRRQTPSGSGKRIHSSCSSAQEPAPPPITVMNISIVSTVPTISAARHMPFDGCQLLAQNELKGLGGWLCVSLWHCTGMRLMLIAMMNQAGSSTSRQNTCCFFLREHFVREAAQVKMGLRAAANSPTLLQLMARLQHRPPWYKSSHRSCLRCRDLPVGSIRSVPRNRAQKKGSCTFSGSMSLPGLLPGNMW